MSETPIALALIALIGTLAGGFFKLFQDQNKTHSKIADGLKTLTESGNKQAEATREVAEAAKKGNQEAAERNGHLGEQNVQITKLIQDSHRDIIGSLENVHEQHVDKQVVDTQEVKTEIVTNQVRSK